MRNPIPVRIQTRPPMREKLSQIGQIIQNVNPQSSDDGTIREAYARMQDLVNHAPRDRRFGSLLGVVEGPINRPRVNWSRFLWTLGVIVAIAVVVAIGLIFGWTQAAYEWVWMHSTGRPYTHIIQDRPSLFVIPAVLLVYLAAKLLPFSYSDRLLLIVTVGVIAFVGGHVFW